MSLFTKDVVRIDKNISYHYLHFKKYSLDDSKLMFMLLVYFAKQHQHELFANGILDPIEFCKEFNLSPQNYIWQKHEQPRQQKENSAQEIEKAGLQLYDTVFENALYCLFADIFSFPKGKTYLSKLSKYKSGEGIDSIQFVTSLSKRYVKVGKTQKRIYDYELSEKFISNLSFLFFNVNINSLKISTKKNNDGLYFFIKNTINEMRGRNQSFVELDFTEIQNILNIQSEEASYVKKKIKKSFAELLELPDLQNRGIEFSWFRLPNHKFDYGIRFEIKNGALKQRNEVITENIWREVKEDLLKNLLYSAYKRRYPEVVFLPLAEVKHNYTEWLKNEKADTDSKISSYNDYQTRTNNEDIAKKMMYLSSSFPKTLAKEYEKYL